MKKTETSTAIIKLKNKTLHFEETPIHIKKRDINSVFGNKNNKTLGETLEHDRYISLKPKMNGMSYEEMESPLGEILGKMKKSNDKRYLNFLNKYGDEKFCEFSIDKNLYEKGIYCWTEKGVIKYVGRCTTDFKNRINEGYGKIYPKNCYKDGQTTNCHLNYQINKALDTKLFVYKMTEKTNTEIQNLEKEILAEKDFEWNTQKR